MKRHLFILFALFSLAGCAPALQKASQFDGLKICLVDLAASQDIEAAKVCFASNVAKEAVGEAVEWLEGYLKNQGSPFFSALWQTLKGQISEFSPASLTSYSYERLSQTSQESAKTIMLATLTGWLKEAN